MRYNHGEIENHLVSNVMNIEKNFFVICENAVLDKDSGTISLIKIFETLNTLRVPVPNHRFFLVANFIITNPTSEERSLDFQLSVISPSGNNLISNNPLTLVKPIDITLPTQNIGIMIQMTGLTFPEIGIYKFNLSTNGNQIASLNLEIKTGIPQNAN
jgi:hypothetical protein